MRIPFQALVIRYTPDQGRGEALNIGLILRAPQADFVAARFLTTWARITQAFPHADERLIRCVTEAIASGVEARSRAPENADRSLLQVYGEVVDIDEGFLRHSVIGGASRDAQRTFEDLFHSMVAPPDADRPTTGTTAEVPAP